MKTRRKVPPRKEERSCSVSSLGAGATPTGPSSRTQSQEHREWKEHYVASTVNRRKSRRIKTKNLSWKLSISFSALTHMLHKRSRYITTESPGNVAQMPQGWRTMQIVPYMHWEVQLWLAGGHLRPNAFLALVNLTWTVPNSCPRFRGPSHVLSIWLLMHRLHPSWCIEL